MKKAFTFLLIVNSLWSFSQRINLYQYVLISEKYDFQNTAHEYELNKLLKCQLEEYGFTVFYKNDPAVQNPIDPCLFLKANVINKSNIFLFKLLVEFRDCNNAIVLQTEVGGSKEKDRYDAFNEALDGALKSDRLSIYKFEGIAMPILLKDTNEILENPTALQAKNEPTNPQISTSENTSTSLNKATNLSVETSSSTAQNSDLPEKTVVSSQDLEGITNTSLSEIKEKKIGEMVLYAQDIDDGFQLVDTTPKIILKMTKTVQPNYFNANKDDKYGVIFLKENEWFFEYYTNGNLVVEKLNLRFPK